MPVHTGKDSKGCFAQWGSSGKKYYYTCGNEAAMKRAKAKAGKQGQAAHAHGYTGNSSTKFEYITTNLKPIIRNDSMEGKDWIVVPTQMITEGVHNGSDGPIFYPADELAKIPAVWNHKPVVVYHPVVNGVSVSACSPEQLTTRKVGVLMNTKWDSSTKKLGTETWLDPSRIAAVDERVSNAIDNNEMMEVSTGLFMDLERTEGEWNGEEYIGIARNLQPDHLALLPDQKGACSIEDGAGFIRSNQECRSLVINELSHDDTRRTLSSALHETIEDAWIEEVYSNFFIYETGGKLYKQEYEISDGIVSFTGLSKLVERKTTFVEVTGLSGNKDKSKGNSMNKKKIVDALIKNEKTSWTEDHREALMELDDDILTNMSKDIEELSKPVDNEDGKSKAKKSDKKKDTSTTVNTQKDDVAVTNSKPSKPETMEEYIAKAPPEIRESLRMSVNTMNREKAALIEAIKANEQNTFTDEHLKTMDIEMLQAIARMAVKPTANDADDGNARTIPLYLGQGDTTSANTKLPEPLPLPTMNFGEDKKTG